ncbi:hypothetical protein SNEBB_009999 [Seison nebaliae]|nr:hypothetical protein SNEBB_009999 [Seison nebaliae]
MNTIYSYIFFALISTFVNSIYVTKKPLKERFSEQLKNLSPNERNRYFSKIFMNLNENDRADFTNRLMQSLQPLLSMNGMGDGMENLNFDMFSSQFGNLFQNNFDFSSFMDEDFFKNSEGTDMFNMGMFTDPQGSVFDWLWNSKKFPMVISTSMNVEENGSSSYSNSNGDNLKVEWNEGPHGFSSIYHSDNVPEWMKQFAESNLPVNTSNWETKLYK